MDSADLHAMPRLRVTPDEGRAAIAEPGRLNPLLLRNGSMELRWFGSKDLDPQVPHDRDELYVVVAGTGMFVRAEERAPFGEPLGTRGDERVTVQPGDALFVPAGTAHRFEALSNDFGAWMIFYGPEGGEA